MECYSMKTVKNKVSIVLILAMLLSVDAYGQEVIDKAVDSIGKQLLVKDYEKAFSYAGFIIRYYRTSPMTVEALDACEKATSAYATDLAAKQKWPELLKLETALSGAPESVKAKAANAVALAKLEAAKAEDERKKEAARQEAERLRKEEENRQAEAEKARLAQIEAAIKAEREIEIAKEEERKKERADAAAREAALLAERARAETAQRAQIDRLIQESRDLELAKERIREAERKMSEERQRELESNRQESEEQFRRELSRLFETAHQANADTVKLVSSTNIAVVAGLGILAVFVIAGITLLVVVSLRQQRMQHEQFQSTLHAMQAMRTAQPIQASLALPFAPQDAEGPRALPGGSALMIEDASGSAKSAEEERTAIKDLLEKCQAYGQEIDKVTGRRNASRLVADHLYKISRHLGYSEQDSILYFAVGLVYDIGFLNIDPAILRAEQISEDQFAVIKTHTAIGLNMVFFVPEPQRTLFKDGVSKHHENLDGTGYPYALKGDAIPYIARALRVIESYVALISSREYRRIMDRDSAIRELYAKPEYYDQDIVKALDAIV